MNVSYVTDVYYTQCLLLDCHHVKYPTRQNQNLYQTYDQTLKKISPNVEPQINLHFQQQTRVLYIIFWGSSKQILLKKTEHLPLDQSKGYFPRLEPLWHHAFFQQSYDECI